ncbi:unnamed protein product [Acanthoscelides obtectus]|uniref:Endonuclease/exonuclease/phosphatase domain-containing protein n=1 Tax=Acanthoscelides obtectus TaxID=200917 RepID=A0A9P0PK70_ACAOB|nr:unnamed protein product [Acanthoscelides obtectus]CAK1651169.1 hypothetical protein AOBTE_LOCUS17103 [Acanthoscelides obtectus]
MGNKQKLKNLRIAHVNARSLVSGFDCFKSLVEDNDLHIVGVSETWLSDNIPSDVVSIRGFNLFRCDRQGRGGGVAIFIKSDTVSNVQVLSFDNSYNELKIEFLFLSFKIGNTSFCVGVIYKPPNENLLSMLEFLYNLLPQLISEYDNILVLGDFNINMLVENKINDCLEIYGMAQIISEPTRITERTSTLLDPIFISSSTSYVSSGTMNADRFSDHQMVYCDVKCSIKCEPKFVTYRVFNNINSEAFDNDLYRIDWESILYFSDIESKVEFLTSNLLSLFDLHCSERTVRVTKPKAPWRTANVQMLFRERGEALSKYKMNPSEENWNSYKSLRNYCLLALRKEKSAYLEHLHENKNSKSLYKSLKQMHIQSNKEPPNIPVHLSNPYKVNDYFTSIFKNSDEQCIDKIIHYRNNRHI